MTEQICMARVTGRKGHDVKSAIARSHMEVLEEPRMDDGRKRSLREKCNVLVIERGRERGAGCYRARKMLLDINYGAKSSTEIREGYKGEAEKVALQKIREEVREELRAEMVGSYREELMAKFETEWSKDKKQPCGRKCKMSIMRYYPR